LWFPATLFRLGSDFVINDWKYKVSEFYRIMVQKLRNPGYSKNTTMKKTRSDIALPPYTFGVEIECLAGALHPSVLAYELRDAGFRVWDQYQQDTGYYEEDDDDADYDGSQPRPVPVAVNARPTNENGGYDSKTWTIGSDGSVHGPGAIEIKSPILSGPQGLRTIRRFCSHLIRLGVTVNRSCGLHVHVGITNAQKKFSNDEILTIVKRYGEHQATIDTFLARSRTATEGRNANGFCVPVARVVQGLEGVRAQTGEARFSGMPIDQIARYGQHYDRVSVASLNKYGTIEFRQHHGTVNGSKITNWIRFLLTHVEISRHLVAANKRQAETLSGAPTKKIKKDTAFTGLPTKVRKHFKKQANRLGKREAERMVRVEARRAERAAAREARQAARNAANAAEETEDQIEFVGGPSGGPR
jgi:hypothetical protein